MTFIYGEHDWMRPAYGQLLCKELAAGRAVTLNGGAASRNGSSAADCDDVTVSITSTGGEGAASPAAATPSPFGMSAADAATAAVARAHSDLSVQILPNAGHFPFIDQPVSRSASPTFSLNFSRQY